MLKLLEVLEFVDTMTRLYGWEGDRAASVGTDLIVDEGKSYIDAVLAAL